MSLTPEQFNLIATKDDLNDLKDEIRSDINNVLTAIDGLAKKLDNIVIEQVSNQSAHDRFNRNFVKIKKEVNIKDLEVVDVYD